MFKNQRLLIAGIIMYRPLTKQPLAQRTLGYKPCGVIMGQTGAGKTTLSNKLCGTQHKSGAARGSVTQGLYRNDVNCGTRAFSLIDTPGTDSSTETYRHAFLLKEALTATQLNTIFLIIKYNNRFDKIVDNYFEVVQPVMSYVGKTVVMISHMDVSENPEVEFAEICELFAEECPDISNILFFSDKSSEVDVTDFMYACMSTMKAETLTITDEEFHLNFNICELRNQMKVSFNEYQKTVDSIVAEYTELIPCSEAESTEQKDEILHMMIVEFKYETQGLYQTFIDTHGGAMHKLDYYVFAIKMQKENVRVCDEFVKRVAELMSYNLFDNNDVRNLIKRCPHCDLIWYKTEGCDGTTTCGNRVSAYYDSSPKAFFKYVMTRVNGRRRIHRESTNETFARAQRQVEDASSLVTGYGCGLELIWSELPKLQDELILELFKVKTIAEAVELIKAGDFQEARRNYESNIARGFQS